jgi:hypothetical protein
VYAHPISERIDVKVRQSVIVTFTAQGFRASLDYLEVEVM